MAAQRDTLTKQREALAQRLEAAGQRPTGPPVMVFPLHRFTPEENYAHAQDRCTKGR
jgi:hypothetical protein